MSTHALRRKAIAPRGDEVIGAQKTAITESETSLAEAFPSESHQPARIVVPHVRGAKLHSKILLVVVGLFFFQYIIVVSRELHPRSKKAFSFLSHGEFGEGDASTRPVSRQQQSRRRQKEQIIRPFQYWSAEEIHQQLHDWTRQYPQFVELVSAQEAYNLRTPGTESDCPFETTSDGASSSAPGCKTWILTIEDKSQPEATTLKALPEVLLSGALHGDEHVGPTAVMETVKLLLEAAACEAMPQGHRMLMNSNGTSVALTTEELDKEMEAAKQCRETLTSHGIFPPHRKWLARLVTTRRILVLPTANALGYYRGTRQEEAVDPNRDFPYDLDNQGEAGSDPTCLQSIAAQTLVRVLSEHMVQLAVTFHGGMEAVAYEWGAPSHTDDVAPDVASQLAISKLYSRFAGDYPNDGGSTYPVGTMNELVYPVHGGLEDFAYAASWDTELVAKSCIGEGANSVPFALNNDASFRMFMALVETSNEKKPSGTTLGTNKDLFTPLGDGNGHISRNVRLALSMLDLVEPYVQILSLNGMELWDDIVPSSPRTEKSCEKTKVMSVPYGTEKVRVEWTVGGGLTVDHTTLWYGSALIDSPFACGTNGGTVFSQADVDDFWHNQESDVYRVEPSLYGKTHWHEDIPFPPPQDEAMHPLDTIFAAEVDLSSFQEGETVHVYAVARVDQDWSQPAVEQSSSVLPPQTHLVHARTDPTWIHESPEHVVRGRLDWISIPLSIEIGPVGTPQIEKSVRNPLDEWKQPDVDIQHEIDTIYLAVIGAVVFCLFVFGCFMMREDASEVKVWAVWADKEGSQPIPSTDGEHGTVARELT